MEGGGEGGRVEGEVRDGWKGDTVVLAGSLVPCSPSRGELREVGQHLSAGHSVQTPPGPAPHLIENVVRRGQSLG